MIGLLIFPDFQLLDAAGPISVFEVAARYAGRPPSIKAIAVKPGPVRSSSGVEMLSRGGELRKDACLRASTGKARRPHRQRVLRRLHIGRSRHSRWPPRHHALAA